MRLPSVKQAFAIHFLISVGVFLVLLYLMMRVWFPGELFFIDGGWQGLKLIAPIDLILGPALTLILYRPWKKSLLFDMSVIALVQTLALGYGVYSAYNQRTAAIVFSGDARFETISLSELRAANEEIEALNFKPTAIEDLGQLPAIVYATPYREFSKYLEDIMNGRPELRERSDRYVPIAQAMNKISEHQITVSEEGTIVEIPASSDNATPLKNTNQFKIKARYDNGIITLKDDGFEIQRIGH